MTLELLRQGADRERAVQAMHVDEAWAALTAQALGGDRTAVATVYEAIGPWLRWRAARVDARFFEIDDLCQIAWLVLQRRPPTYRSMLSKIQDASRLRRVMPALGIVGERAVIDDDLERVAARLDAGSALATLTPAIPDHVLAVARWQAGLDAPAPSRQDVNCLYAWRHRHKDRLRAGHDDDGQR